MFSQPTRHTKIETDLKKHHSKKYFIQLVIVALCKNLRPPKKKSSSGGKGASTMRFLSFKRPKKKHPKQQKQAAVGLDLKIREIPYFFISTQCFCSVCLETHPSPHPPSKTCRHLVWTSWFSVFIHRGVSRPTDAVENVTSHRPYTQTTQPTMTEQMIDFQYLNTIYCLYRSCFVCVACIQSQGCASTERTSSRNLEQSLTKWSWQAIVFFFFLNQAKQQIFCQFLMNNRITPEKKMWLNMILVRY